MAQINKVIVLTQALKDEMDKHPDVNWSSVARKAFKQHLFVLDMTKDLSSAGDLDADATKRIYESMLTDKGAMFEIGKSHAKSFAETTASYAQLLTAANLYDQQQKSKVPPDWKAIGVALGTNQAPTKFWKAAIGDKQIVQADGFLEGFLTGCKSIFEQYKKVLEIVDNERT